MKKTHHWLLSLFMIVLGFIAGPVQAVRAAGDTGANFTISPVYPANQTNTTLGYFALVTPPGSTGELPVRIANTDKTKTRTFKVQAVSATTNDNGQIDYTPNSRKPDASAETTLTQLVSKPVTIKISPQSQRTVTFNYTIPKKGFTGTVLGSIHVMDETEPAKIKGQFALTNRFAMALGVSMTMETGRVMAPDLKLGTVKPQATVGNKPSVKARLRNVKPVYFRNMTADATITAQGGKKILYEAKLKNGSMAPNSFFDFTIATEDRAIPAGNYTLHMTVKATGKTWRFTRNFTVTRAESTKLAKKIGQKSPIPWWVWVVGAVFVILLLLIIWLLLRLRREKKKRGEDDVQRR